MKKFNQPYRLSKAFTREDIERAIRNTKSNNMAARYLGVNVRTWKKWASKYVDDNGIPLYEKHNNKSGKDMLKYKKKYNPGIDDVLNGKVPIWHIDASTIKTKLISNGYFLERCDRCGYAEKRNLDYKAPLILHYRDLNKRNFKIENLQLLCYNCYFISIGDVFDKNQIETMEQYQHSSSKKMDWDLPKLFDDKYDDMITSSDPVVFKEPIDEKEVLKEKEEFPIIPEQFEEKPEEDYEEDFGMDLVSFLKNKKNEKG